MVQLTKKKKKFIFIRHSSAKQITKIMLKGLSYEIDFENVDVN